MNVFMLRRLNATRFRFNSTTSTSKSICGVVSTRITGSMVAGARNTPYYLAHFPRKHIVACLSFDASHSVTEIAQSIVQPDPLEQRASTGDSVAMTELGRHYFDGEREDQSDLSTNKELAKYWLLKAANLENSEAQYVLSLLLFDIQNKSTTNASESINEASTKEEVLKQIKDQRVANAKGKSMKRKAKKSQQVLGSNIEQASSTVNEISDDTDNEDNENDPYYWLNRSASNNNPSALCYYGNLHMTKYRELLATSKKSPQPLTTTTGDVKSTHTCGSASCKCKNGTCSGACGCGGGNESNGLNGGGVMREGTDRAYVTLAMDCYERAGRVGSAEALYNLGTIYYEGLEASSAAEQSKSAESVSVVGDVAVASDLAGGLDVTVDKSHKSIFNTAGDDDVVITKFSNKQASNTDDDSASTTGGIAINKQAAYSASPSTTMLVEPDHKKSLHYFIQSAALGDATAQFWCGYCYMHGINGTDSIDPLRAINYFKTAGKNGQHANAYYHLAMIYRDGLSSAKNNTSDGDKNASAEQALSMGGVITIDPNVELFLEFLEKACVLESPDALFTMADLYMNGLYAPAVEGISTSRFETAVDSSGVTTSRIVKDVSGTGESRGEEIISKSIEKAVEFYTRASDAGHVEATVSLGVLHYNGVRAKDGTVILSQNKRRAFELYNVAAEAGSQEAWRNLASMYWLGDGVPESKETAKQIMNVIFGVKRVD